ncbi:MAG TPA: histidinol-phosphatase [Bacteroidales bacterium]|nr:histidinol-phosphatase [Bacteroidales bacterium]HPS16018.1 histidinol-phosphatase [Bacteroidales bacterium]
MNYFNFHTHTLYCDGKAEPEDYVKEAIEKKMTAIGFTCHSPLPFENGYSIKQNNIGNYINDIRGLQKKYSNKIKVYIGTEFDFVPGMSDDFTVLKNTLMPDYFIASVHLVRNNENKKLWFIDGPEINYSEGIETIFNNNVELAVRTYYEQVTLMVSKLKPDIIGHIDKVKMNNKNRYFTENEEWYKKLVNHLLDTVQKAGSIVEVNTRGIYKKRCESTYPGKEILKEIYIRKIPVTISSDAHLPCELILCFDDTIELLRNIGFKTIKYFTGIDWIDISII